jgi:alpha-L-fucosidase
VGRESWGYREDEDYYAAKYLMQSIGKILAMGGNYLLNVGPAADGTIPEVQVALLRRVGDWLGRARAALYAAPASALTANEDVLLTRDGTDLFVHLYRDPESSAVALEPLALPAASAVLLNDGTAVETRVELTPRSWQTQWGAGLREERGDTPAAYLRLRGLPVDAITDEPLVVRLRVPGLPETPRVGAQTAQQPGGDAG